MKKWCFLAILLMAVNVGARDFGILGETFPVQEKNLMTVIKNRLEVMTRRDEVGTLQQQLQAEALRKRNEPDPVLIKKTNVTRERLFDPSVTVMKDLADTHGRIFAKKGQHINPLNYLVFNKKLYFIDASDEQQILWIKNEKLSLHDKVILTSGNILAAEEQLNRRIYFDQQSALLKRFNINVVPSVVMRQGNKLLIREINVDG